MNPSYAHRKTNAPVERLPDLELDMWQRFDMWAERAHEATENAIAHADKLGDADIHHAPGLLARLNAAELYRGIAQAARPIEGRQEVNNDGT